MNHIAIAIRAGMAAAFLGMSFTLLSGIADADPIVRDHRSSKGATTNWGGPRNPSPATKPGARHPGNPPPLASKTTKVYPAQAVKGCASGTGYCVTKSAPGGVAVTSRPRNKPGKSR